MSSYFLKIKVYGLGDFPGTLLFNNVHISEVKHRTAAAHKNETRSEKTKTLQELFFFNLFSPDFSPYTLLGNLKKGAFPFSRICVSLFSNTRC